MSSAIPFSKDIYKQRRDTFIKNCGSGKYLFIGNDEVGMNYKDNVYPYRQDSSFLYYFGISQPGLNAVIDADSNKTILFGDEIGIDTIVWTGPLPTLVELASQVGIDNVLPSKDLRNYCDNQTHFLPTYRNDHVVFLHELLGLSVNEIKSNFSLKFIKAVIQQRNYKRPEEVIEIEKAVNASVKMHRDVKKAIETGIYEYELVGVAARSALEQGCTWSFNPIMTINGQTLHNHDYSNKLQAQQMLLFDGGCQTDSGYAGDLTRTWPVSGKFSSLQHEIYDIVVASHQRAVSLLKPGIAYLDVYKAASSIIFDGLKQMGITKGDAEEAVEVGAHTMFFQCGLGHMMGMDVHDMENLGEHNVGYSETIKKRMDFGYKSLRLGRDLEPGFVLTVEPGIYIIPELIDLRKSEGKYLDFINYDKLETIRNFGGIRVEEDFLITENGSKLLGDKLEM